MPIIANTTSSNTFNAVRAQLNSVTKRMNQFSINESAFYANTVTANVSLRISGTLVANSVAGTSGYYLRTSGTGVYWSPVAAAAVINVQTFTSSGTWTKPSGYSASSRVFVQCWGGGGSGGKQSYGNGGSGGGGGGGFNEAWFTLSQFGATETATVGAGGIAVTTANIVGNPGGTTSLGSVISAYGGGGGSGVTGEGNGGGGGGQTSAGSGVNAGNTKLGGIGGASGYAGNVGFWNGGGGGGGFEGGAAVWGGGGGGGGWNVDRAGGASVWGGNGGGGVVAGAGGIAGTAPGGGGGGTGTGTASGAGAAGKIVVTIFPA